MNLTVDGQYCALRNIPVIGQAYIEGSQASGLHDPIKAC
jgi:hypothetical protein